MEGLSKNKKSLERYYKLFYNPYVAPLLYKIATCGEKYKLYQREIAPYYFDEGKQYMCRYIEFKSLNDIKSYLCLNYPNSLQLGGIFPGHKDRKEETKDRKKGYFYCFGQLILDVDIGDLERPDGMCGCDEKAVCNVCWEKVVEPSRLNLNRVLTENMGFKYIFYVFSGRRGYHCWILDKHIYEWSPTQRSNILNVISRLSGVKLDFNVSKDPHHLIKVFLSPHYATGNITVPLLKGQKFNLDKCPNIKTITKEQMLFYLKYLEKIINFSII